MIKIKLIIYNLLPEFILIFLLNLKSDYLFKVKKFENNCYILKSDDLDLYISRPKRLFKYKNGTKNRLNQIRKKYFLDEINFMQGDILIDCGSNIGEVPVAIRYFTYVNLHVVAIEPDPIEFSVLKRNLLITDLALNMFLSNKFSIAHAKFSNNSGDTQLLINDHLTFFRKKYSLVRTYTLDQVIIPLKFKHIKLLKIEVEGLEPEVLIGAEAVLRITDYVAVDTGPERNGKFTFAEVKNIMSKNGFEILSCNQNLSVLFRRIQLEKSFKK